MYTLLHFCDTLISRISQNRYVKESRKHELGVVQACHLFLPYYLLEILKLKCREIGPVQIREI